MMKAISLEERDVLHMRSTVMCMQLLGDDTKAWGSQNNIFYADQIEDDQSNSFF